MNSSEFIEAIKNIEKSALIGLEIMINSPPGRRPSSDLVEISTFYKSLDDNAKAILMKLAALASKQAINNILSVIDGNIAIESSGVKGELELYFNKGDSKIRLNSPEEEPLSEIYRSIE